MRLITSKDFRRLLGDCSPSKFDSFRAHPNFPLPVRPYPTARALLFLESEAHNFIAQLGRERTTPTKKAVNA